MNKLFIIFALMNIPFLYQQEYGVNLNDINILNEEASKHLHLVLRKKNGDEFILTNGKGLKSLCTIISLDKKNINFRVNKTSLIEKPNVHNTIAISLLKNTARIEWFLEKAVEFGINEIIPINCMRTEKQKINEKRFNNILVSAMLQSKQYYLPVLRPLTDINKFPWKEFDTAKKFIAHCLENNKQDFAGQLNKHNNLILIGPEGDFTEDEISKAIKNGCLPVSLGNNRLRTETAGVYAAAQMYNLLN